MLAQRLVKFLNYNSEQYIITRTHHDYGMALTRLERMRKLIALIKEVCESGDKLTSDEAIHVLKIQRHLHALHILPPDEMPTQCESLGVALVV